MKKTLFLLLAAGAAFAQGGKTTVSKVYDGELSMAEREIVPAVEAMPEAKFNFAPTDGNFKDVRTFAQQAKHLAAVVYIAAAGVKNEKPPVDTGGEAGPESMKTKAQIVQFVKDAFSYAHTAFATLNSENELDLVKSPFGGPDAARARWASVVLWHSFDHYGQMVVYLRMNGIVPPASSK
jgi:hypothetical protein